MSAPWVYRELRPPATLADHVQCLWTESVGDRFDDPAARVVPDGCIDLVWISGRPPSVAGPATMPFITTVQPGALIVGIRFRSGMASSVLGAPASEIRDGHVALSDLWGKATCDALAPIAESRSAEERLGGMQTLLVDRLEHGGSADVAAVQAARWLGRHPNGRLDRLYDLTGLSERQLRRRFEAAIGYGPKTFQRIVRFQHWLRLANSTPTDRRSLTDLAAAAGYADQAHLTREVTRLAGLPPAALLATTESGPV